MEEHDLVAAVSLLPLILAAIDGTEAPEKGWMDLIASRPASLEGVDPECAAVAEANRDSFDALIVEALCVRMDGLGERRADHGFVCAQIDHSMRDLLRMMDIGTPIPDETILKDIHCAIRMEDLAMSMAATKNIGPETLRGFETAKASAQLRRMTDYSLLMNGVTGIIDAEDLEIDGPDMMQVRIGVLHEVVGMIDGAYRYEDMTADEIMDLVDIAVLDVVSDMPRDEDGDAEDYAAKPINILSISVKQSRKARSMQKVADLVRESAGIELMLAEGSSTRRIEWTSDRDDGHETTSGPVMDASDAICALPGVVGFEMSFWAEEDGRDHVWTITRDAQGHAFVNMPESLQQSGCMCPDCAGTDSLGDRIDSAISEHGQFIMGVLGYPEYSYTIGNAEKGLPELIVTGMPPSMAAMLLNQVGDDMRELGRADLDEVLTNDGYSNALKAVDVHPTQVEGCMHQARYRLEAVGKDVRELKAVQILWSGPERLYPGDEGHVDPEGTCQNRLDGLFIGEPMGSA
jgi:hypothetical protein